MKKVFALFAGLLFASLGLSYSVKQEPAALLFKNSSGGGAIGTPTPNLFLGKNGVDLGRNGAATGASSIIFTLDPSTWPHGVTSGSLVLMSGMWPDNPLIANGYPRDCTAPCAPTFTDNGSGNTWSAVFTAGSGCKDASGFDHGFYYSQNYSPVGSGTAVKVTEVHAAKISNTYWNISNWYNVATSGVVDGASAQSCRVDQTPANNTAPNITGTALTTVSDGDMIYVEVDDEGIAPGNTYTSITVDNTAGSTCHLLEENTYIGHAVFYCIQTTHGSFTPKFTIAQASHGTFTIYAVAFKGGSGGTAPSAGNAVLLSAQNMMGGTGFTTNVACPTTTTTLVVTDDSADGSISDSNGDTFTTVNSVNSGMQTFYKLGISISNQNTFTVTFTTTGAGIDLISFYCLNTTAIDTFTAAGGDTQIGTATAENADFTVSGLVVTTADLPTGTPTTAGDIFIITGANGQGPVLASSQPTGVIFDFPIPTTITACNSGTVAGVCGGDFYDYGNGDVGGHFYQNSTSAINFGWTYLRNGLTVMVTAFK